MADKDSGQERREGGNQDSEQPASKYEVDLKKDASREGDHKGDEKR